MGFSYFKKMKPEVAFLSVKNLLHMHLVHIIKVTGRKKREREGWWWGKPKQN